ncbi:hypothetical protein A3J90_07705 [candidate division WOR-1 bacterium RIFOXYC2_FULL_37_10]|uniref:Peptidase A2 domain-containing protein n=1 Tax=candidate division WOR-1 bacterium RIFOXYB2_FULL_37_13 TaxID=1802579 RepID=A0A1F4SH77_UNCSA|nr:MAG: hypothetical protein A2246_00705 [candidate division WOR-1 bacterium RIFOXYA2_FULL_37_7]OGC19761.1 MAG: hypothetical protein A2310_02475 [candidate division WOR-1 bacterium RIFOXYB2_FULL_37_13]OGC33191.1 MAG: hypothetical protein A3J90_07705 [candidate division WOR-1 bacterium RIFOXYC2_FULL_37_10]
MITFKYRKEKNKFGKTIFRPVADIVLNSNDNSIEVGMYIDSGADVSLIPLSIGLALGFSQEASEIREMKGISSEPIPYVLKEVNFIFNNYKFKGKVAWALIEEIPILLGRMDIFTRFKIIFDESEKVINFVPKF